METFGKAAAAAAASKTELAVQTATADGVTFSGLEGGYYLITSTYGTASHCLPQKTSILKSWYRDTQRL